VPNDRDRERARRRLQQRQASQTAQLARRRRDQQVIGAVVTVLVVVLGVVALARLAGDPAQSAACRPAPPAPKSAAQFPSAPAKSLAQGRIWDATVVTNCGTIGLELYGDKAPQTVASFIYLTRQGYYANSPCHRLTSSQTLKVLQCGDPTGQGSGGPGYSYGVENVPADGQYPAGTLAMARADSPGSNGSQFFVTYGATTLPTSGGGYSVFGRVRTGLDLLDAEAAAGTSNGQPDGPPARPISIESITVTPR